jgi:hypothetical protein
MGKGRGAGPLTFSIYHLTFSIFLPPAGGGLVAIGAFSKTR